MKFRGYLAGSALAMALVLTACGGGGGNTGNTGGNNAGGETIVVTVPGPELRFDKGAINAAANKPFKVTLTNNGNMDHNFVVEVPNGPTYAVPGPGKDTYLKAGESKTSGDITLPAGSYKFYCSFPGHETLMVGNVVVQ